jgi:hypothetical protein
MPRKPGFIRLLSRSFVIAISLSALAAVSAMPAYASSGGGCAGGGYGFGPMSACISASGGNVLPDGYITWENIPPNCSVALELVNPSGYVVARGNYACGAHHYGPLSVSEPSGTTWYSEMWVFSNNGNGVAESPAQHLSY